MSTIGAIMASTPRRGGQKKSEPSNQTVRNYEVQRYSGGRWMVDSVADEKEVAITMAKALLRSGKATQGVRVTAVQTKPSGEYSQITIYRRMPGEPEPVETAPQPRPAAKVEAKAETEKRDFKHVDPPAPPAMAKRSRFGHIVLALKIAFLVGFAVVAFEAIHLLSR